MVLRWVREILLPVFRFCFQSMGVNDFRPDKAITRTKNGNKKLQKGTNRILYIRPH